MLIPEMLEGTGLKYADARSRAHLLAQADRDLSRRSMIAIFAYVIVWVIIFYTTELNKMRHGWFELLGALLAVTAIGRFYMVMNFARLHAKNPRRWRRLFFAGTVVSAAIWGVLGGLAMEVDGLGTTAMVVMLPTAGIAAGGIVSLAPAPRLGMIFLSVLLLPSFAVAALSPSLTEHGIALLLLAFFAGMLAMWRRLHLDHWMALVTRDELVRAKEEAEAAALAKGQFIASVSHELRTPLTSVVSALGLIIEYPPDGMASETWNLVDMAYRNGKRLSVLVNDIVDFEKLDAHQMTFHPQSVQLAHFLRHAIELNEIYAERHGVSFVLEPVAAGLTVYADDNRLLQVMTNLLSNAAKHSPRGGEVLITARVEGSRVRVAVIDHGAGVPEAFRSHIFERFSQAEQSTTGKKEGTGLGLAISKAIIEQMGGSIGFESVEGQGATFFFELPLVATAAALGKPSGQA